MTVPGGGAWAESGAVSQSGASGVARMSAASRRPYAWESRMSNVTAGAPRLLPWAP